MDFIDALIAIPEARAAAGLGALLLIAWLSGRLARIVVTRSARLIAARTAWRWDDALIERGVFTRVAQMVPTVIVQLGIGLVPDLPPTLAVVGRNVALACTILFGLLAVGGVLSAVQDLYERRAGATGRSIKSHVQLLKLAIYLVGAIFLVAAVLDRSPLLLLSGIGALSAVLLLVFKDTLLSFVAGLQISSNDMLRVGDWIEMPSAHADGDVIDVALHTVKVRNWDLTITTIPTWRLISDPFKNWRGMSEAGGRRIKRSIAIDAASVRFLTAEEAADLGRFRLLGDYLSRKQSELAHWHEHQGQAAQLPVNRRRLTNLGTFRAYALAYLRAHPGIHQDMTLIVRQLETQAEGVPLELYCFTRTTGWVDYEGIQSDIFDHLIAILPEFGLQLYQRPGGGDLRHLTAPPVSVERRPQRAS